MGIGVFDQLYTMASDEIHDVQALLKSFRDNNYDRDLADIKESYYHCYLLPQLAIRKYVEVVYVVY